MSSWEVRAQSAASLLQDILRIREEMSGSLRKSKTERGFSRLEPQGSPQGSGLCYACTCWSSQGSRTMSRRRLSALPVLLCTQFLPLKDQGQPTSPAADGTPQSFPRETDRLAWL